MTYHTARQYAMATFAALIALYLRYLLTPLLGQINLYHTVWLAVAFSAWYCGVGPSILTTLLGALGVDYYFLRPLHSFAIQDRTQFYGMLGFLLFSGAIIALGESNRRASAGCFRLAAIVDSSGDAIISKNLNGVITTWNRGAEHLFGWTEKEAVGQSITLIIPPELHDEEREILRKLQAGERVEHSETIRRTKSGQRVIVSLTISPVRDLTGKIVGASKIARDITQRKLTEIRLKNAHDELEARVKERTHELLAKNEELLGQTNVVRDLSARLLQLQDEERRRIARELHDSTGQLLAAINMNISKVAREKEKLSPSAAKCVEENLGLVEQALTEVRTMSHLLHPPLLDEVGLESAIKWYAEGFAHRSKIEVALDMPEGLGRLSGDLEIAIFRVMQECLTNIHRHSGSAKATIRLVHNEGSVYLEVKDEGKGIPMDKQHALNSYGALGVGFRGMRERLRQLGGSLQIHSDGNGTTVSATLPVRHSKTAAAMNSSA